MADVLDKSGQVFRILATEHDIVHCDYFSAMVGHILFYTRAVLLILRSFNEPKDNCQFIWMDGWRDGGMEEGREGCLACEEARQKWMMNIKNCQRTGLCQVPGRTR